MKIIIANSNPIHKELERKVASKYDTFIINNKEQLTVELLKELVPKYIFFPHWSYIIPQYIYENYECIVFHMTDLPFGRGGSPLQNLIIEGYTTTKISALRVEKGIDTGDVYLKYDLSLEGSAKEIFLRASKIIEKMIHEIITTNPIPITQKGHATQFKRRKPEESNIKSVNELTNLYDHIRMLDAEGYPHAFMETEHFRFEFNNALFNEENIIANVRITKK